MNAKSLPIAGASAFTLGLLFASTASAQTGSTVLPMIPGLLGAQQFSIGVSARASYDTNVARGNDEIAALRGVKQEDVTYGVSANANIVKALGQQTLSVGGGVGYNFYQRNSALNSESINVNAGLDRSFGRCGAGLSGGWSRSQSDLADLSVDLLENISQTISTGASVSCQIGNGFGQSAGVTHSISSNSAARGVDSTQTGYSVGLTYSQPLLGTLSLFGSYGTSGYDLPAGTPGSAPGFESYNVGLALYRPITARLTGSASITYINAKPKRGGQETTNIGGAGSLSYAASPRLSASLSYSRNVAPVIIPGYDYQFSESMGASVSYRLGSRIGTSLGVSWGRSALKGTPLIPVLIAESQRSRSIFGSISTPIGTRASLSFGAGYDERTANPSPFSYHSTRANVSLSVAL